MQNQYKKQASPSNVLSKKTTTSSSLKSHAPNTSFLQKNPLRLAAIDLGTNSFHMIIVELQEDMNFLTIDRAKEMIRIGDGSITTKLLSDEAMNSGIETLLRFRKLAEQRGVEPYHIVAFATSAIRESKNGGDFMERVTNTVGIRTKIISGEEEARLIYLGVRNAVEFGKRKALIVDAGGGSVEFIVGNATELKLAVSKKLGVARMFERFISTDPISKAEERRLRKHLKDEIKPIAIEAKKIGFELAIASSGTAQNIAAMILADKGLTLDPQNSAPKIEKKDLERLTEKILAARSDARRAMPGLDPKRGDLIIPGILLFQVVFELFNLKTMVISDFALREGIVIDYLSGHLEEFRLAYEYPDVRRRSVVELAKRCYWDEARSKHIAGLSVRMFDLLKRLHGFSQVERELLEYAAFLHNIGYFISASSHHKHSHYIILNGELRGFQPEEIQIMANVARYHRKSLPKPEHEHFEMLSPKAKRVVTVLASILRLANAFDRTHRQNIAVEGIRIEEKRIIFRIAALSDPEIEIWAAMRMTEMMEIAFRKKVEISIRKGS
ncbi:MAG: Ppx/GppA phosphatase family protein [Chloroherpetonaceae bacterium]|nr:Ppx/GppA phosphatase family protein [Chloroherpetonaceae bacterium]